MHGFEIRKPAVVALRLLLAATVVLSAGCSTAAPPPPATATPTATTSSDPRTDPTTATAAGPSTPPPVPSSASPVSLAAFSGTWNGHTRLLVVSASGDGHETVSDGCCTRQIDLTFRLSNPRGTSAAHASATATITAVALYAPELGPAPKIGQTGTVDLREGVLVHSLDGFTYCSQEAEPGACGA